MSGLMSLVLYSLKRTYPASIKGLGEWATALLLVFIGSALGTATGNLPIFLTITIARIMLAGGLYMTYVGTQRFFGETPRHKPWIALISGLMLVQLWFTFVDPSYQVRLVLSNVLAAYLFGLHTWLVWKHRAPTFACVMFQLVLVIMTAIQLIRLVTAVLEPVGDSIFDTSPLHLAYVTSFVFCILLLSIGTVLLATERLHAELEHLATHDSLTNSLTRRSFNDRFEQELERCRRYGHVMALMIMDLDHFKRVNDTFGHQAGDQVLISFVSGVNALLRRPDQLGRFGGEEFVLMLPETSLEEAASVAERIRQLCAKNEQEPFCTVSIGITTYHQDSDTLDKLMARADAAMYRAKDNGRNRVETD